MPRHVRLFIAALAALLVLPFGATQAQERLPVVASFSILGDFVAQVGGDRINLRTLVGPDGDAHTFQPSPADAKAVGSAKIVFVNGLGFEGWMPRLVKASGSDARVIETASSLANAALPFDDDHGHDHGHNHGAVDPHVWQSVAHAKVIVGAIRDGLIAADPAGEALYEANAAAYLASLEALEADVKTSIAAIPPERRKVITSHDAFGYFAQAYGVAFIAPQGVSTETEANAKAVARIIKQIRKEAVPAVFVENISDPRLIRRIADETKARIGGTLYSDALSTPDGPAGTYIAMVRHNIRELVSALAP